MNHRNLYEKENEITDQPYYNQRNDSQETSGAKFMNTGSERAQSTQMTTLLASSGSGKNTNSLIKIVGMGDNNRRNLANSAEGHKLQRLGLSDKDGDDKSYAYKGQPYSLAIRDL